MKCVVPILLILKIVGFLFWILGCSNDVSMSSSKSADSNSSNSMEQVITGPSCCSSGETVASGNPQSNQPDSPPPPPVKVQATNDPISSSTDSNVVNSIIRSINTTYSQRKGAFISEHLNLEQTKNHGVKFCFYYEKKDHVCDLAQFYVYINAYRNPGGDYSPIYAETPILNLNNGSVTTTRKVNNKIVPVSRYVNGISGRGIPVDAGGSVPGILYAGQWNQEGKINIATRCALDKCHDGIMSMAVIGTIVVNYDGKPSEIVFIDRKHEVSTNDTFLYNLANRNFEIVSGSRSFDDWCNIQ